jgi:hypothetical protein
MQQAKRRLDEVEQRAAFAEYRLIEADAHVSRAELAKLAGDEQTMRKECEAVIAICDDPTCGYAWAKQDAEKLLNA